MATSFALLATASAVSAGQGKGLSTLAADRQNMVIQERASNYCKFVADVFYTVAVLRDQGTDPNVIYQSMLASNLPDDMKAEAANIIVLVYSVPELTPDEIGFAIYGQCVENITGVRRST